MKEERVLKTEGIDSLQVLLSEGSFFEGELQFKGSARLGGKFKGHIKGEGTLVIEPGAFVSAQIEVSHLVLLGYLEGEVKARKQVLMEPPARFKGEVTSPSLSIKEGVSFEGSSKKLKDRF